MLTQACHNPAVLSSPADREVWSHAHWDNPDSHGKFAHVKSKASEMRYLVFGSLLVTILAGCAALPARMTIDNGCRAEAGPEPYEEGRLFGATAVPFETAQQQHQAWQDRFDDCFKRRTAEQS